MGTETIYAILSMFMSSHQFHRLVVLIYIVQSLIHPIYSMHRWPHVIPQNLTGNVTIQYQTGAATSRSAHKKHIRQVSVFVCMYVCMYVCVCVCVFAFLFVAH